MIDRVLATTPVTYHLRVRERPECSLGPTVSERPRRDTGPQVNHDPGFRRPGSSLRHRVDARTDARTATMSVYADSPVRRTR
jgi:hypothetical protein